MTPPENPQPTDLEIIAGTLMQSTYHGPIAHISQALAALGRLSERLAQADAERADLAQLRAQALIDARGDHA
jgi:hypothetical protein